MDYKKFYTDISIHVEMMVTPEMRMHACADPIHHDLSFQVFRLLSGYGEALEELQKLRPANIQQQVQLDSEQKQGTFDNPVDASNVVAPRELT